jgi:glycosyltransferase involved in cell wall biosynthesis
MTYDVCAAVVGDLATDARVRKEAASLSEVGYSVSLIGCRYDITRTRRHVQDGVSVVEVPLERPNSGTPTIGRARTLGALWRNVLRTRARAYHSHNLHVALACLYAAHRRGAAWVYDAHELYGCTVVGDRPATRLLGLGTRMLEGLAVRSADAVITTNPSRVIALQARHGYRSIESLGNVPHLVEDVQPADPGFPKNVPILLYQGGIYAEARAFRKTIEALRLLDDVHLVVLGFGRDRDRGLISAWARENGVEARVHILPALPFDQLVMSAASATVGLVPIRPIELGHVLGDTNKLHEYLMAGLPVIASDLPEIRRVVCQGTPPVGELFDPESPTSIAEAYRRVVDDDRRYAERRREARRLAQERYHWALEEKRLLEIYHRLIGPPPMG